MDYQRYLQSDVWQTLRAQAIRRAHGHCLLCPRRSHLEVHHRTYVALGHERVEDLVVLCRECHRRHHGTLASDYWRAGTEQLVLPFSATIPRGPALN
jgi:5-methylcytosine-specific restriction endonuclease McrA